MDRHLFCADGGVTVVISHENHRYLQLSRLTSVKQSEVVCIGKPPQACFKSSTPPQSCQSAKGLCPCERDTSEIKGGFIYMQRMMSETLPLCKAARNDPKRDLKTDPFRFLLIGLGGGVLPMHALANCPPGTRFETVEIDPRVVHAATEFFGYQLIEGINTVEVNDCAVGVEKRTKQEVKYDVVFVDAFTPDEEVPESCKTDKFIHNVRDILRPGSGRLMQHVSMTELNTMLSTYEDTFGSKKTDRFSSFGGSVVVGIA